MSTLRHKKQMRNYTYFTVFLIVFTIIYEQFSYGVTSTYMRLAFLIPFIGGVGVSLLLPYIKAPKRFSYILWKMAIPTLVVGFVLKGIFDIYGSVEPTVYIYFYVGMGLMIISFISYVFTAKQKGK